MRHALFNLLAAVSLVLCVATAGVWVRSYFVTDRYLRGVVTGMRGEVLEEYWVSQRGEIVATVAATDSSSGQRVEMRDVSRGVGYIRLALTTAIAPFAWTLIWATKREQSRYNPLACHTCGYDLRASGDRCPECGTAVPAGAGERDRSSIATD